MNSKGNVYQGNFSSSSQQERDFEPIDSILAEMEQLGITTREQSIAYVHLRHGWPLHFIASELELPREEVTQQVRSGARQLMEIMGISRQS